MSLNVGRDFRSPLLKIKDREEQDIFDYAFNIF